MESEVAVTDEPIKFGKKGPTEDTQTIGNGVRLKKIQYLAGFKEDAAYPTVPMLDVKAEHTIDGTIADVYEKYPELEECLFNDVKMCSCGKPCAYTLEYCNACGKKLPDEVSKSENVFSAFLFGVKLAARGFPYKISLRRETEDVLIFDDMLQLSPCHLNGIPKKYYIPDWRFLLPCPQQSLELLEKMEAELWEATKPFLADPAWRKAMYKGDVKDEDVRRNVICSFNFPPSQFQMHIQWIVPPLMPFHHYMAVAHHHFHEGRAFPLTYVKKCLALNKPYEVTKATKIETIMEHFAGLGVDYTSEWTQWYEKICLDASEELQNWSHNDFDYVIEDEKAYKFTVEDMVVKLGEVVPDVEPGKTQARDMNLLRNYGRPYNSDGKPAGTYIQKPLQPKWGDGGFLPWPPES
jgi:hypothetical protein